MCQQLIPHSPHPRAVELYSIIQPPCSKSLALLCCCWSESCESMLHTAFLCKTHEHFILWTVNIGRPDQMMGQRNLGRFRPSNPCYTGTSYSLFPSVQNNTTTASAPNPNFSLAETSAQTLLNPANVAAPQGPASTPSFSRSTTAR